MLKNIILYLGFLSLLLGACDKEEKILPYDRTVLVYMAADNNLSEYAKMNIRQMEQGISSGKESGNLLVYIDPLDDVPRLLQITRQGEKTLKVYPEQNSASPEVMKSVMNEACMLFPSENYGLVLWSHATAWLPEDYPDSENPVLRSDHLPGLIRNPSTKAFAQDITNDESWLELSELVESIPDHRFDFILFDGCYMGSVEVVYALRNKTDFIIASPTEILVYGFPYDKIADNLVALHPDLAGICRTYFESYSSLSGAEQSASIALIKTEELNDLYGIVREIVSSRPEPALADVAGIQSYDRFRQAVLFDMDDYMSRIASSEQLDRFRRQLDRVVIFKSSTPWFYNSYAIRHFCGLSVYIPQESLPSLNAFYKQLEWGKL